MKTTLAVKRRKNAALLAMVLAMATGWQVSPAQMPPGFPSPRQMLQGRDAAAVQKFKAWSQQIKTNPRNVNALDNRAMISMQFSQQGTYRSQWTYLASKDLERALQLDPRDFYAWHNYGELNYQAGDLWMAKDHSNALRAAEAFSKAIQINPKSARSYMGRGWALLAAGDRKRADQDFGAALKLDPSLRPSLEREVGNIRRRSADEAGARGTLDRMSRYILVREALTAEECEKRYKGLWIFSECRVSTGMNPGPRQPSEVR